jgi:hypothetical protein
MAAMLKFPFGGSGSQPVPSTRSFKPKKNVITDDYDISREVLGLGVNGKVLSCRNKKSGGRFALKVKLRPVGPTV